MLVYRQGIRQKDRLLEKIFLSGKGREEREKLKYRKEDNVEADFFCEKN